MRVGWAVGALLLCALSVTTARGADVAEVRVLSGAGVAPTSTVHVRTGRDATIEDRTPGAKKATQRTGPASTGETFAGEVTLFVPTLHLARPTSIEVDDPVVSAVRLFPEGDGALIEVFVRQPVTYTVSRPSAAGEVELDLVSKARRATIGSYTRRGRPRVVRPTPQGEEVAVDAESLSYDQTSNTLTARGGVTLTRSDMSLTADEVVYDRTNAIVEAKGNVVVTDPQGVITGEFAHLNMEDESGWIDEATGHLELSRYSLAAKRLDKLGGPLYHVERGVFTTCECGGLEKPSWSLGGEQTDVTLHGAGVMKNALFRVKDVPVLWFPYLPFPANNDRQSGFLTPVAGNSSERGFFAEVPFYWAINKSSDATVAVRLETAARVGVTGEYRYSLSRTDYGEFAAAYFNESFRTTDQKTQTAPGVLADVPENRFAVSGMHRQKLPGNTDFYLDLFAVGDDAFLHDISSNTFNPRYDFYLRSTRYTTSQIGLLKRWGRGYAWLDNVYQQDLIDPQELALQRLPRVRALEGMPLLDDRVVARVSGEAVHFTRQDGFDGLRGDVAPELFLPFRLGSVVNGSFTGRLRETAYQLQDTEQVAVAQGLAGGARTFRTAPELPDLSTTRTRELGEIQGRVGQAFGRVYDFPHLGLAKLKHTIEPEVQYLFVPQAGRPTFNVPLPACGSLPVSKRSPGVNCDGNLFSEGYLFDELDAINKRNFISYGFTTRILGRAPRPEDQAAPPPEPPVDTEAKEEEGEEGEATGAGTSAVAPGVDPRTLPQGLPLNALPSFMSRTRGGPNAAPRELLRASVLHGYDVSRSLVRDSHLSDVDLGLQLTPVDYLGVTYNTTVSLEERVLRGFTTGIFLREPWWSTYSLLALRGLQTASTVGVAYRFIEKNTNRELDPTSPEAALLGTTGLNDISGSVYLRLGTYAGFGFLTRYNLNDTPVANAPSLPPMFLERSYLFRLVSRCNCWMLEAGVEERINPKEDPVFRMQLTLVGLGSFGQGGLGGSVAGLGLGGVSQGLTGPSGFGRGFY